MKSLYLFTFIYDLPVWAIILAIHVLWGTDLRWEGNVLCTDLRANSWPAKTWYRGWGGTTFGHGIMYGSNPSESTKRHEHVHVEQYQAAMLQSFTVGLLILSWSGLWVALFVWFSGFLRYLSANWLTAILRGEPAYRGSAHEEHAYAEDLVWTTTQATKSPDDHSNSK